MHLRDRLLRLKDEGRLIVLTFGPHQEAYLAKLLRLGQDYIEFEACEPDETVVGHHIMPLAMLTGITVSSVERQREQLQLLFEKEVEEGEPPQRSS